MGLDGKPEDTSSSVRRRLWAAMLAPVVLLLPFLNRALHVDDPMFVWVAKQIAREPLDFFGGVVDMGTKLAPYYELNHNPPATSYYLAMVGPLADWREWALHAAFLVFPALYGWGMFRLAVRFTRYPLLATLATVATPGFLVSASTLMTDVPMVALYVAGVSLWLDGLETSRARFFVLSAVVLTLAGLSKYFGMTAVPLLAAYTILRERRLDPRLGYLAIPVIGMALFQWWHYRLYGQFNLFDATALALDEEYRLDETPYARVLLVTAFLGGCFLPLAFYALRWWRVPAVVIVAVVTVVLVLPFVDGYSLFQLTQSIFTEPFAASLLMNAALMLAAGFLMLGPVALALRRLNADTALLLLWVGGTLVFAMWINHFINARVLLPALPPLALLVFRGRFEAGDVSVEARWVRWAWVGLMPAVAFSLWLTTVDTLTANSTRDAAEAMAAAVEEDDAQLRYFGMWGFQYYMELEGAKAFSAEGGAYDETPQPVMQHGDYLGLFPWGQRRWTKPPKGMATVKILTYPQPAFAATFDGGWDASFYSHRHGILPYRIGLAPAQEYGLYRWTGPSYKPDPKAE